VEEIEKEDGDHGRKDKRRRRKRKKVAIMKRKKMLLPYVFRLLATLLRIQQKVL
jgi:hypothetical protein